VEEKHSQQGDLDMFTIPVSVPNWILLVVWACAVVVFVWGVCKAGSSVCSEEQDDSDK